MAATQMPAIAAMPFLSAANVLLVLLELEDFVERSSDSRIDLDLTEPPVRCVVVIFVVQNQFGRQAVRNLNGLCYATSGEPLLEYTLCALVKQTNTSLF
mmetsp:Transcript_973/g.1541  ORF Transcript_973/g.1541 Transcript_973/m.1541 type:complete len:99 (-) Transcript_973:3-299(-)